MFNQGSFYFSVVPLCLCIAVIAYAAPLAPAVRSQGLKVPVPLSGAYLGANTTNVLAVGMARSGLYQQPEEKVEADLQYVRRLKASWIRDVASSSSDTNVQKLARVAVRAHQLGIKFLLNIVPLDSDYSTTLTKNRCGWNAKALSQIDMGRYVLRLRKLVSIFHESRAVMDAVEVGNEDDGLCYDADASGSDQTWLAGYSEYLRVTATELKRPDAFPNVKLLTFGIAFVPDQASEKHVTNPLGKVLALQSLNGYNYLENSAYKIDAIAVHVYASPEHVPEAVESKLREPLRQIPRTFAVWVTEWGFLDLNYFGPSHPLEKHIDVFLDQFNDVKAESHDRLGPCFFYSLDRWLQGFDGTPLPAARAFSR